MPEETLAQLVERLLASEKKKKVTPITSRWKDEAIVLHVYHSLCEHCGEEYTAPSHCPFILRTSRSGERHQEAINTKFNRMLFDLLPQRIEHIHLTIRTCEVCFHPREFQELLQLDLFEVKSE